MGGRKVKKERKRGHSCQQDQTGALSFSLSLIRSMMATHHLPAAGLSFGARIFFRIRQQLRFFWVRWVLRRDSFRCAYSLADQSNYID
jgi:hypothetical protein